MPLSAPEQLALRDFVKAGGTALLFCDNNTDYQAASRSFTAVFGLSVTGTLAFTGGSTIVNRLNRVVTGPAGTATGFDYLNPGWFSNIGRAVDIAVLDAPGMVGNHAPSVAALLPGALGRGSGAVVLFSDSDILLPTSDYGITSTNDNILILNSLALQSGRQAALAAPADAEAFRAELFVNAKMDIYRAGGYEDGSDGIAPVVYSFPARAGRVLEFMSVGGDWTCTTIGVPPFSPDGTTAPGCNPLAVFGSVGPFSGYANSDFSSAMVGMFLENSLPSSPPPAFRFYLTDNSMGGIPTDFRSLSPLIGQVFFIGDGLTGTGTGAIQIFRVPPTATHLYLGFIGSCNPSDLSPSCYSDNGGTLAAVFHLYEQ